MGPLHLSKLYNPSEVVQDCESGDMQTACGGGRSYEGAEEQNKTRKVAVCDQFGHHADVS